MKLFNYILLLAVSTALILPACVKEKNFPPEPKIEFLRYQKYGSDSADCVITFKDGDGDIGLVDGDTVSADDFQMKYLYKDTDGVYKPFDAIDSTAVMDTLFYSYRVPDITPAGQYKALEGEIKAKLRSHPLYFPGHTSVKFEIRLRDRAGHWSNITTSSEIIP
ncbi:MAG: hypothetical protein JWO44_1679 [Bacteroidetes bacterium]|jgi:hypothetical protein|nr:hypothetical protein [Bacteroidota bacterium]